jgi:glycosyltransferase involved in cell wall biosynthesis
MVIEKFYIPKEDRKKILLIADDVRFTSGVSTVARELVLGTANHYNYGCIGGSINHPEKNQRLDLSQSTNDTAKLSDSQVFLYPVDGYGNPEILRQLLEIEKPDAIFFITDPRYYTWLFPMEHEIRNKGIKMIYLQIWDCPPAPLYNRDFYRSVDGLLAISKQTENINKMVLGDYKDEVFIDYVPHGINENHFYPIKKGHEKYNKLQDFKKIIFKNKDYDFVLLFNSRNIRRKSVPDAILAFKLFLDSLPEDKAEKCVFLLHTQPVDENGTDLNALIEAFFGEKASHHIVFSNHIADVEYMNMLYNTADVTILLSSNEGWGLSLTESLMTGTPIIANVTGGMQDQMRFEDENGEWVKFDEKFQSNHLGKYKKCGKWALPVFPSNVSIQGSVQTPYIFDDRADFRDAKKAIEQVYNMSQEEREDRGAAGREWVLSDESKMSAKKMAGNMIEKVDKILSLPNKRKKYKVIKTEPVKLKKLKYIVSQ